MNYYITAPTLFFQLNLSSSIQSNADWAQTFTGEPWGLVFGSTENQILALTGNYLSLFDF